MKQPSYLFLTTCFHLMIHLISPFDTVDHGTLIQQLIALNIDDQALMRISDYLTNITQSDHISNAVSSSFTIIQGVPQD
jgi:hypothetical protein